MKMNYNIQKAKASLIDLIKAGRLVAINMRRPPAGTYARLNPRILV